MSVEPGWYPDPAEPSTQRYWDGEGWIGDALPVEATPPPGPPEVKPAPPPEPVAPVTPDGPITPESPGTSAGPAASGGPGGSGGPGASAGSGAPASGQNATNAAGPPPGTVIAPPSRPTPVPPPGWPQGLPYPYPPGTPAPRPHGLRLASPGSRFMARFVDILLVLFLNVLGNGWFAYQWWLAVAPTYRALVERGVIFNVNAEGVPPLPDRANVLQLLILLVAVALWFAYEVPAIASNGQTLGKRLFGIKVVGLENGQPVGFRRAWRRWNPLGLPTLLWSCCGIGFVLQFVDCLFVAIDRPLHQAMHDKSAATVVVDVSRGDG